MNWILLIALMALLAGAFIFKKLWLGALVASIIVLAYKTIFDSALAGVMVPLTSGLLLSVELALLLYGAYFFYTILSANKHFETFTKTTAAFSSKFSGIIILCLFMGSFLEGIAGFGIPAMLMAPILLTLGFKPLTSIVLPLAANTTAVTFGALGTPFKIGLGIDTPDSVSLFTALLNILPALALPFILAFLYSKTENQKVVWKTEWKIFLGAGFCFVVPYFAISLVSIEYPSVGAGLVGLLVFVSFFIPKGERPLVKFWWNTFYPYLLFVGLLIVAKLFLSDYTWEINSEIKPLSLYQPGIIFILCSLVYLLITQKGQVTSQFMSQSKEAIFKIKKSVGVIVLLICFAQLIQEDMSALAQLSYSNLSDLSKVFITPLIGMTGSFVLGTATMSNVLFANGVKEAVFVGSNLPLFLALLNTGSSIGNAISFQNIVLVKSVINHPVAETSILKYNLMTIGFYLTLVILTAFFILLNLK